MVMTLLKFAPQASVAQRRQRRCKEYRSVGSRLAACASFARSQLKRMPRLTETKGSIQVASQLFDHTVDCWAAIRNSWPQTTTSSSTIPILGLKRYALSLTGRPGLVPWPRRDWLCGKFKEKVTFDEKLRFRDSFLLNKRKYKQYMKREMNMSEDEASMEWDDKFNADPQEDSDGEGVVKVRGSATERVSRGTRNSDIRRDELPVPTSLGGGRVACAPRSSSGLGTPPKSSSIVASCSRRVRVSGKRQSL